MTPFARVVRIAVLCVAVGLSNASFAQQAYPSKPIRLIVPFPPGGSVDPIARMIGQKLGERLGQQVFVDNRPGANGTIGTEILAKAPPDGHTLIHLGPGTHVINAVLVKNLPYDSMKDFAPVATIQRSDYTLVVHPSLPVGNVKELVALAKAKPGQIAYASSGNGNMNHLAAELFNMVTGVKTYHIPYKGAGPALTDLISGQVQMHFSVTISALPHVKSGRLKPLAFGGDKRFPAMPQVQTFAESGLSSLTLRPWQGILAPVRTPKPIIDRLSAEIARILALQEITSRLATLGMTPLITTPEEFAALMASEYARSAEVIKAAHITLN